MLEYINEQKFYICQIQYFHLVYITNDTSLNEHKNYPQNVCSSCITQQPDVSVCREISSFLANNSYADMYKNRTCYIFDNLILGSRMKLICTLIIVHVIFLIGFSDEADMYNNCMWYFLQGSQMKKCLITPLVYSHNVFTAWISLPGINVADPKTLTWPWRTREWCVRGTGTPMSSLS
jgi:hypothetical protein